MRKLQIQIPLFVFILGIILGVVAHNIKNSDVAWSGSEAKKVVLYIDLASIPAMAQIKNYLQMRDDKSEYIFALTRFDISDKLDSKNVHFVHLDHKNGFDLNALKSILNGIAKEGKINMHIHVNMSHSVYLIKPLLDYVLTHKHRARIKSIDFYDDGSMMYVDLDRFAEVKNLSAKIYKTKAELAEFFKTGKESVISDRVLAPYVISMFYPSKYHMLEPRYFDLTPKVAPIFALIQDNIVKINFFQDFKQRGEYMRLLGYSKELDLLFPKNQKSFIFTGTTTWTWDGSVREDYATAQLNAIVNFTDPKSKIYLGDKYKIYFKGHPGGLDINKIIMDKAAKQNIDITSINPRISFELLIMSQNLPTKVGGIASTLYFSLPKDKIAQIIFVPNGKIKTREDALNDPLVRVMIKLEIIKPSQVIFWDELRDEELNSKKVD